ncbi:hypothetical protein ACHAPJ_004518 [Fusarium lateritium]
MTSEASLPDENRNYDSDEDEDSVIDDYDDENSVMDDGDDEDFVMDGADDEDSDMDHDEDGDLVMDDYEDVIPAEEKLPNYVVKMQQAATYYLENVETTKETTEDIISIMPGNKMTTDAFMKGAEDILSNDNTMETFVPRSLLLSYITEGKRDALDEIAAYFEPRMDIDRRDIYIVPPLGRHIEWFAVCEIQDVDWHLKFYGVKAALNPVPSWARQLFDDVEVIYRQRFPDSSTFDVDIWWRIDRTFPECAGPILLEIISETTLDRSLPGCNPSSARINPNPDL